MHLGLGWAVGQLVLVGLAYALPQRQHLQLMLALLTGLCAAFVLLTRESARWLAVRQHNPQHLHRVCAHIARVNRSVPFDEEITFCRDDAARWENPRESMSRFGTLKAWFCTRVLATATVVLWLAYLTAGLVYYTLIFGSVLIFKAE